MKKVLATPQLSKKVLDWSSTFKMPDGTTGSLGTIAKTYKDAIAEDLQRLKLSGLLTTAAQNHFIPMPASSVYVYVHKEYIKASDVKFTSIARTLRHDITETNEAIWSCDKEDDHDEGLLPFFLSNPELIVYYTNDATRQGSPGRVTKVQKCVESLHHVEKTGRYRNIDDEKYFRDHNTYEYAEDIWTKRLCTAIKLRYPTFDVSYTAAARGRRSNSLVLQKMPPGTPLEMFLFHGSPDMMIQFAPIGVEQDAFTGCIEAKLHRKQPYQSNSMILEEAGQLIAYIHQMTGFAIRKSMKGDVHSCIKGVGMYVTKSGKSTIFQLCLSEGGLSINACTYFPISNSAAALCKALEVLICYLTQLTD